MSNSKITFKTITLDTQKFLNVINPDTQIKSADGILSFNTGIYGSKVDNAMPDFIIDIFENGSPIHQNLVNLKTNLILGNNLQAEDDIKSALLDPFLKKRNKSEDNLKTVYGKCAKDFALFNACVLQVIYNREGNIAEVYHIPTQDFRLGIPNKYGKIEFGFISKNWGYISNSIEQRRKESVKLRMWDPAQWEKYPTQLLYLKDYSYKYYAVPSYNAGINWILVAREISEFHKNNIHTNFFLAGLLTQLKGSMSDEQIEENANEIEGFYSGSKGRKVLLSYVDDMANKPVFDQFSGGEQDKLFDVLGQQCYQNIISAHNASPIIVGIDSRGADLGGDSNKMFVAISAFEQLVTSPMKQIIVDGFNRIIVDVNGLPAANVTTEPLKLTPPQAQPDDLSHNERRAWLYGLPEDDTSSNTVDNPNQIPQ